ncbi:EF-hand domain-containing protein [Sphingomonas jatrophae]|uniref:EF hand n=1 Tax=Sphingomonas jatrophae TaxID=1166337 RepID=A0A1I6LP47_9SPHN|nr:EF-hand domain-containing protein [Sphingomonas jatrophae]SFS05050.1 EF hand [Sphingomonas jatrophae]
MVEESGMMRQRLLAGGLLALGMATAVSPAAAQPGGRMRMPATRAEATEQVRSLFTMLDRNKDGAVTADEMPRFGPRGGDTQANAAPARPPRMFAMADADGDGRVTQTEMEQAALTRFDRADTDRDGKLSDAEREAARPQRPPRAED